MATGTAIRTVEGLELPQAGRWTIDPAHSGVEFVVRHMMISKVRGRFTRFAGHLDVAERPEDSAVEVTIDPASISTADDKRDEHLRSADFLDVERHPEITFHSTSVKPGRGGRWAVEGELTLKGVTRPVVLDVELEGVGSAYGGPRAVFSGAAEIDREEFGLTWNMALEAGGVLVGKQLRIELSIQAVPEQ